MSLQHIPGEPEPVPLPVLEEEALEVRSNYKGVIPLHHAFHSASSPTLPP